jgi:hypothetical protein
LVILGTLLFVVAAAALAFYVGMMYGRKGASLMSGNASPNDARRGVVSEPTPAPTASNVTTSPEATFENRRASVDLMPAAEAERMSVQTGGQPLSSEDPEFLYLYGRAMLLTDRQREAVEAFDRAIQKAGENMTPRNGELKIDARLAKVAAQMRNGDSAAATEAARELDEVIRSQQQPTQDNANANAGVSPSPVGP